MRGVGVALAWVAVSCGGAPPPPAPPLEQAPTAGTASAPVRVSAPPDPAAELEGLGCGELVLRRRAAEASGLGARHPRVQALEARLLACPGARPSAAACVTAWREDLELASQYGPLHPSRVVSRALAQLCRDAFPDGPPPAPPPDAAECDALRARRVELEGRGLGPRHPEMVATDARLASCR